MIVTNLKRTTNTMSSTLSKISQRAPTANKTSRISSVMAVSPLSSLLLTILVLIQCAAQVSSAEVTSAPGAQDNYWLDWIGTPEVSREHGKPIRVSSVIYTGNEANGVMITKEFGHSFDIKRGGELELGPLLAGVGLKFDLKMSHGTGNKTAFTHRISLDRRSKGYVMFNEDLVRTKGRARKKYAFNLMCYLGFGSSITRPECYKDDEEVTIEVVSTELDESGHAKGTFSVEYEGTDKYRHEEFHHLANRTAKFAGAREVEGSVKSSYECAERAKSAGFQMAIYDIENMKCRVREARDKASDSLYDGSGHLLGHYDPLDTENLDLSETFEPRERDRWLRAKRCDLIHEFMSAEGASGGGGGGGSGEEEDNEHKASQGEKMKKKFLCKRFPEHANSVIMFQRQNKNTKKQQQTTASTPGTPISSSASQTPLKRIKNSRLAGANSHQLRSSNGQLVPHVTASEGDNAHPKFYLLKGRQYPVTTATQKIRNVLSAYDCAEQAIGSEKFLAIYKPRDRLCLLEPVVWNFGRLLDGTGKTLGPYGLIHLREKELTEDPDKTLEWFRSGELNSDHQATCDLVHETDEAASFSCKSFEFDGNENSIVLLRYVDPYEVKRINRFKRQREYERLLFSGSQHEQFYSINNRDFPLKCVRTIPGVNSARKCGEAAIESGKYLAVYKPISNICILKEVDINEGQAFDRWNKQLGFYDVPFYDAESSQSSRDFDRWLDLNECDVIHLKEDGMRTCKKFPNTDDAILMFRRLAKET